MGISYTGGNVEKYQQGDYVFYIRQFMPFYAMRAWGELQKIIAPVIGGAVSEIKNDNMDTEIRRYGVHRRSARKCAEQFSAENKWRANRTRKRIFYLTRNTSASHQRARKRTSSSSTKARLNEVFSGRPIDMIVLMVKIFKVNYLDFSKLSSVPIGFRNQLGEVTTAFRESCPMFFSK